MTKSRILFPILLVVAWTQVFASDVRLPAHPTDIERALTDTLVKAFDQKDPAILVKLSHWKESEGRPAFFESFYTALIERGCRSITVERVDPALATERIEGNDRVRESLPVRWIVTIHHPTAYDSSTSMNAGLDGGTIKLTTSYVVHEGPNLALLPTPTAVTPAASHPSRQP